MARSFRSRTTWRSSSRSADAGIDVPADLDEADPLTPCADQIRYGTAMAGHVDREAALVWASAATRWARSLFAEERMTMKGAVRSSPIPKAIGLQL